MTKCANFRRATRVLPILVLILAACAVPPSPPTPTPGPPTDTPRPPTLTPTVTPSPGPGTPTLVPALAAQQALAAQITPVIPGGAVLYAGSVEEFMAAIDAINQNCAGEAAAICATLSVQPTPALPTATPTSSESVTLRDVLSDEGCQQACFMGIEPGVTTQAELEIILDELNITYQISPIGLSGHASVYSFRLNDVPPFIRNDYDVGIGVGDGMVDQIVIPLQDSPTETILSLYGAPTRIADAGSITLAYPTSGIAFAVSRNNNSEVAFASILDEEGITNIFIESYPIMPPCTEPAEICRIATATPAAP